MEKWASWQFRETVERVGERDSDGCTSSWIFATVDVLIWSV